MDWQEIGLRIIIALVSGGGIFYIFKQRHKIGDSIKLVTGDININCKIEMIDENELSTDITRLSVTLQNRNSIRLKIRKTELEPIYESEGNGSQKSYHWEPMSNIYDLKPDEAKTIDFFHEMAGYSDSYFRLPDSMRVKITYITPLMRKIKAIGVCSIATKKLWDNHEKKIRFRRKGRV